MMQKSVKIKKNLYTFIKHSRSESSGVALLKSNGSTYTDPVQQATVLNQQFESVFSKHKALSLKIVAEQELWFQGRNPKNVNGMSEITITNKGVESLLKDQNPNKASGPDEITPRLLKELHHEIAPSFTKTYRSSLSTGTVPNDWKTALVVPV